jgi:DEAD/DEAH box helicase domain-containing protein
VPALDPAALLQGAGGERIVATYVTKSRPAVLADWPKWADLALIAGYRGSGIDQPWHHQVIAAEAAWAGRHTALVTSAGSGKSLAFWLPALTAVRTARTDKSVDAGATVLYLAPTKALTADQVLAVSRVLSAGRINDVEIAACDGDTSFELRGWIQSHADVVATNPDFLHHVLLPGHRRWSRLLRRLRYVIVDEAHAYRGLFGAHVSNVLRRLRRLAAAYGAHPVFLLASATAAEPAATAARLIGAEDDEIVVVAEDTAPHATTTYLLWEPALISGASDEDSWAVDDEPAVAVPIRRSARTESAQILADLVAADFRVLAFGRSRRLVELIASAARTRLAEVGSPYAERVAAYRGGYLPEERRELEAAIRSGELRALATTNALELGFDISGLDAVILTGWPGSLASFRQQAGRAGRAGSPALVVFVGEDNPLDSYFLHHPDAIFDATVEATVFDPQNPWVLAPHLCAAAGELSLTETDLSWFGLSDNTFFDTLATDGFLRRRPAGWFWTRPEPPSSLVDLRSSGGRQVQLVEAGTGTLLGTVDRSVAEITVHTGAVYIHQGRTFLVNDLDLDEGIAWVTHSHLSYTTSAFTASAIEIQQCRAEHIWGPVRWGFGSVEVTSLVTHFTRLRLPDLQVMDYVPLESAPQALVTTAAWWSVPTKDLLTAGLTEQIAPGAIHAAEHGMVSMLPLLATCDRWDLGGVSTVVHPDTGAATVFVHDAYPGGAGFAQRGFLVAKQWLQATRDAIASCPCTEGCPSCIQSPKCGNGNEPLHKAGAVTLLNYVLAHAPRD